MCLSKVYLKKIDSDNMVMEEAINIVDNNGTIEISTIFGEKKQFTDHIIKEINFVNGCTVLCKKEDIINA